MSLEEVRACLNDDLNRELNRSFVKLTMIYRLRQAHCEVMDRRFIEEGKVEKMFEANKAERTKIMQEYCKTINELDIVNQRIKTKTFPLSVLEYEEKGKSLILELTRLENRNELLTQSCNVLMRQRSKLFHQKLCDIEYDKNLLLQQEEAHHLQKTILCRHVQS